jgi:hypothetical protein
MTRVPKATIHCFGHDAGQLDWHGVAKLPEALAPSAAEGVVVRKGLKACGLSNGKVSD